MTSPPPPPPAVPAAATAPTAPTKSTKSTKSNKSTTPLVVAGTSLLPLSKVRKLVKLDSDLRLCTKEALFLIAKTTEFAIKKLASEAQGNARLAKRFKSVKYEDLANAVQQRGGGEWFFLQDVITLQAPLGARAAVGGGRGGKKREPPAAAKEKGKGKGKGKGKEMPPASSSDEEEEGRAKEGGEGGSESPKSPAAAEEQGMELDS